MCSLVENLRKHGATLPELLPSHFKASTGSTRQRGRLCCGLWLVQAWEAWCREDLTSGRG